MTTVNPTTPHGIATGPNGETAEFSFITPGMAAGLLAKNIDTNRRTKAGRIAGYVRDLKNGSWTLTGEAIKLDRLGRLIDGQNRCMAIIQAEVGAWALVVRGLDPNVMKNLDSGAGRTGSDALTIAGLVPRVDAQDVAAVARMYAQFERGEIKNAGTASGGTQPFTRDELFSAVEAIPNVEMAARYAKSIYRHLRIPVGAIGVAFLKFHAIDPDATTEFFGLVCSGVRKGVGDPILTLEKRVAKDLESGAGHRILPGPALYYLFRTWNAWRNDEKLSRIQIGSAANGFAHIPKPV